MSDLTANFLKDYQNVLIRHVVMPGSHDAGLADASYGSLGLTGLGKSNTVTQSHGVGQQALWGSRFFDIRITKSGGALKAYHSPSDTRKAGGVGQTFTAILDELCGFVKAHATEFVIVRLSHLHDSAEVFAELAAWIANNKQQVHTGTGNLANNFVWELAGKLVFVIEGKKLVGKKFANGQVPGQKDGFHKLYQNKGGKPLPTVSDGLCLCGEFSNTTKLEKIVSGQTERYSEHDKHRTHALDTTHLFCLYWTSTGGNIKQNTVANMHDGTNFQKVRDLVAQHQGKTVDHCLKHNIPLKDTKTWSNAIRVEDRARMKYAVYSCSLPNIILYDFVNEATSEEIIGLNGLTLCA